MVHNVQCTGIHIRQVLFDMEGRLGRMMFCRMKGTIKLCEGLVGVFVQVEGDVKEGDGLSVGFGGDP